MTKTPTIKAAPQKGFLERELQVDVRALFKSVGKAVLNLAMARPLEAVAELPEVAASLGLSDSDEGRTWNLIFRGFERAICELLREYYRSNPEYVKIIARYDWNSLENTNLSFQISMDFFLKPDESDLIKVLGDEARRWLADTDMSAVDINNLTSRLPRYFVLGLHNEWRSNPAVYGSIVDRLNSPFLPSLTRQLEWSRYNSILLSAIGEPIFDETFSLEQIYVPARAFYFIDKRRPDPTDKSFEMDHIDKHASRAQRVVWLADEIESWVGASDKVSTLRIISGGPGSGKSSFAKMIAAAISSKGVQNTIFIPLHLLDFNLGISKSIEEFLRSAGYFSESPLDSCSEANPIFLILDGLDELQMQGQASQAIAGQLVRDVCRMLDKMNINANRVCAIITGREISVQSAEAQLKAEGEILHVIPYYLDKGRVIDWRDEGNLLDIDQRDLWWAKYGQLAGLEYEALPAEFKEGELGDVTAQPLLNYLVALSHRRGGVKLDANTNINSVYADLLTAVYERGWAKNPHPAVEGISHDHFVRLLEEVALSVWHGAGRTATLREVEEHCRQSKISNLLPGFEEGASSGLSNLLLAFYFRQKGRREDGDKTFEFTHKTFAEYLTALRVVRALEQISVKISQNEADSDDGWDDDEAMYRWLSVCGKTRFDSYIISFIRRELKGRGERKASEIQERCSRLFSASLVRGWPMQRFPGLKFIEQQRWARNAEEALFACINACALVTTSVTRISWPIATSFGEFVRRVQGQRRGPQNVPLMDCLSYLDLTGACLDIGDYYGANLNHTILENSALHYTILSQANLDGANLLGSMFLQTNLVQASIKGARFEKLRGGQAAEHGLPMILSESQHRVLPAEEDVDRPGSGQKRRKQPVASSIHQMLKRRGAILEEQGGRSRFAE